MSLSLPVCTPFMLRVAILMLALLHMPFLLQLLCGRLGYISVFMVGVSWLGGRSTGPLPGALVFHSGQVRRLSPESLVWCTLGLLEWVGLLLGQGGCVGILGCGWVGIIWGWVGYVFERL